MSNSGLLISYHPDDAYFASKLATNLRLGGLGIWIDVLHSIDTEDLSTVAQEAPAIVPILSPSYRARVLPAINLDANKVFPVVAQDLETWPEGVRRDLAVDFDGWEAPERFELHLKELIRVLDLHSDGLAKAPVNDRESYLYRLFERLSHAFGHVPLAAHAEPVDEEAEAGGDIVLSVGDSLVDRIARNAEMVQALTESDIEGLIQLKQVADMHRYTDAYVIAGVQGAGKTASLQHLTMQALRKSLKDAAAPLPVYADLARWKDGAKFLRFLDDEAGIALKPYFEKGNVALFLDHLEETTRRNWQSLSQWLEKPEAPDTVIVAVDAELYGDELELPIVSLDLLSDEQAEQWQTLRHIPEAERLQPDNLSKLARLPFYFNALLGSEQQVMPRGGGAILAAYVDALISRLPTVETILPRLSRLAVAVIDDEEAIDFDYQWAVHKLGDRQRGILRRRGTDETGENAMHMALRSQILIRSADTVRFSHPLLHSYFAALALIEQGVGNMLRTPEFDAQRRLPGKWDQAVMMATQFVNSADQLVLDVADKDPVLASLCILHGAPIQDETLKTVRKLLIGRLEQNDWRFTRAIVSALRRIGENELVELMIENLAYGDVYQRRVAAGVLGEVGHVAAVPVLVETLADESLRTDAQQALIKIGSPAAKDVIPFLSEEAAPRWETRAAAAQILRAIDAIEALPYLAGALYDPEYEVRWSVANAISEMGAEAVPLLMDVLHDDDALQNEDTLRAAATAIIWMNDPGGLEELAGVLKDVMPLRRAVVAEALGQAENPSVVPALIATLTDTAIIEISEEQTRIDVLAAESLEQIGTPEALAAVDEWEQR